MWAKFERQQGPFDIFLCFIMYSLIWDFRNERLSGRKRLLPTLRPQCLSFTGVAIYNQGCREYGQVDEGDSGDGC